MCEWGIIIWVVGGVEEGEGGGVGGGEEVGMRRGEVEGGDGGDEWWEGLGFEGFPVMGFWGDCCGGGRGGFEAGFCGEHGGGEVVVRGVLGWRQRRRRGLTVEEC